MTWTRMMLARCLPLLCRKRQSRTGKSPVFLLRIVFKVEEVGINKRVTFIVYLFLRNYSTKVHQVILSNIEMRRIERYTNARYKTENDDVSTFVNFTNNE